VSGVEAFLRVHGGGKILSVPNMICHVEGNLAFSVHNAMTPTREEWDGLMRLIAPIKPSDLRILVFSDGGGPEAAQRSKFVDYTSGSRPLIAVMTSSVKAQAIVTAISWFVPSIKHFPVNAAGYDGAVAHLGLDPEVARSARAQIRVLCTKLTGGVPASLPAAW
jgi:hypothetical protein